MLFPGNLVATAGRSVVHANMETSGGDDEDAEEDDLYKLNCFVSVLLFDMIIRVPLLTKPPTTTYLPVFKELEFPLDIMLPPADCMRKDKISPETKTFVSLDNSH